MQLLIAIALKHLMARKRQSLVSLMGIVLGTAFFLAISSLMQGSEKDFIRRLIDNAPHITVMDEFREPHAQPVYEAYPKAAVELRSLKPQTEIRGIRGYEQTLQELASMPGVLASPVMAGQALVNFAGRDVAVTLNGMVPEEIKQVSTIETYMIEGSIDALMVNQNGVVIGAELARKLSLAMNDNITISATTGQVRTFKIVGIFRTGRSDYDESQTFVTIKRVQALLDRPNRANRIIIKLADANKAPQVASMIEGKTGYKSVSWQEASQDIMSTLAIRNIIMYTVVSAVLVVAAFGIYNVISTVVMEKQRDIAIMKSMGFHAGDIQWIVLGMVGCGLGLPLGCVFMSSLMQIRLKPPGSTELIQMPIDWSIGQFIIAASFGMFAAMLAALMPARKAAHVQPVDILRGS